MSLYFSHQSCIGHEYVEVLVILGVFCVRHSETTVTEASPVAGASHRGPTKTTCSEQSGEQQTSSGGQ
jgi:hypothetical protein